MPEAKQTAPKSKPAAETRAEPRELVPAGEATSPEVQQLLAELQTARDNGATDEADDIVTYLAELGYSA